MNGDRNTQTCFFVRGIELGSRASAGLTDTKPPPEIPTAIDAAIAIGMAGPCALAAEFDLGVVITQSLEREYITITIESVFKNA
jgi:hypothetical protein